MRTILFSPSKVVFSTSNDVFEGNFAKRFYKKILTENISTKDVSLVKEPTHTNVNKLAFHYSDGIIFNNKDIEQELKEYAKKLEKPILEYTNKEEYIDNYSEFFDQIMETKK